MKTNLKLVFSLVVSRFYSLFFFSLCFVVSSYAQTVTGTVTDNSNNPVEGVSVQVKGTTRAAATNNLGRFEIIDAGTDRLLFTSIGFAEQEVAVDGRSVINITLATDAQSMNEVVVTALGISKEARRLGYAATTVKPDELTVNRSPNVMNALQGKVAGVNISALGTG